MLHWSKQYSVHLFIREKADLEIDFQKLVVVVVVVVVLVVLVCTRVRKSVSG